MKCRTHIVPEASQDLRLRLGHELPVDGRVRKPEVEPGDLRFRGLLSSGIDQKNFPVRHLRQSGCQD